MVGHELVPLHLREVVPIRASGRLAQPLTEHLVDGRFRPAYLGRVRVVSWGISFAMVLETAALWTQAIRGTTSHYNIDTPLDGAIFGVMGVMILINTLLIAWLAVLFFVRKVDLPAAYLWGIRLGFLVVIAGSVEGLAMISNRAHTVGRARLGHGVRGPRPTPSRRFGGTGRTSRSTS